MINKGNGALYYLSKKSNVKTKFINTSPKDR